jgi:predicted PurR-regulated permease PerM
MLGWILYVGRGIFVPIVSSILVVYFIVGVSRMTSRLPVVGRAVPEGVHYLIATLVIGYLLVELVAIFTANLAALAARAPAFQSAIIDLVQRVAGQFGVEYVVTWETLRRDALGDFNIQRTIRSGISSAASIVAGLFLVLLNVVFMMLERRSFQQKLVRLSPDPARTDRLLAVVGEVNDRVGRYLGVKTLINIALGLLSYGVMWAAGLEFAAFWAILIGLFNYVPYIGSIVGVAFPVAMAIVQFPEAEPVILMAIALIAAQILMGNVVEPMVMGASLNLSPYVILVSLTAWSALWGVSGAIVSVPITAVLLAVLSAFPGARWIAVLLSKDGEIDEPGAGRAQPRDENMTNA